MVAEVLLFTSFCVCTSPTAAEIVTARVAGATCKAGNSGQWIFRAPPCGLCATRTPEVGALPKIKCFTSGTFAFVGALVPVMYSSNENNQGH